MVKISMRLAPIRGIDGRIVNPFRTAGKANIKLLVENPDHAEALAWHGAATLSWLGMRADLSLQERIQLLQKSSGEMDQRVNLEPDHILARMARGVVLRVETPKMPKLANPPGLVENARADRPRRGAWGATPATDKGNGYEDQIALSSDRHGRAAAGGRCDYVQRKHRAHPLPELRDVPPAR